MRYRLQIFHVPKNDPDADGPVVYDQVIDAREQPSEGFHGFDWESFSYEQQAEHVHLCGDAEGSTDNGGAFWATPARTADGRRRVAMLYKIPGLTLDIVRGHANRAKWTPEA